MAIEAIVPFTSNFSVGFVVPIPTLPLLYTKSVATAGSPES